MSGETAVNRPRVRLVERIVGRFLQPSSGGHFFYIEPGVRQVISYVVLLPEVSELIRVQGLFSLSKERIFPARHVDDRGLLPHKVVRTYQVVEGQLVGRD